MYSKISKSVKHADMTVILNMAVYIYKNVYVLKILSFLFLFVFIKSSCRPFQLILRFDLKAMGRRSKMVCRCLENWQNFDSKIQ